MNSELITNKLCYESSGIPHIDKVREILNILINNNLDFIKSHKLINDIIIEEDYSLSILLKEIIINIINLDNLDNMPKIIIDLANLENMVSKSTFNTIYITALIGIFKKNEI
jgi:hypothetical protein